MADFCHARSTDSALFEEEESCCKPCYCDETCGSTLNCCLEQFDLYKEVEINNLQCTRPIITFVNVSRVQAQNYYMVSECLGDETNKCMQKPVAKWGPFFPAYSKAHDKIYFNKHCAECNGDNDTEEWHLSLTCNVVSDHQLTLMGDLIEDVLNGKSCEIVFIPQKDTPVDKFKCVKHPINRCNVTGEWSQFDPIIDEACKTVNAPVRDDQNPDFLYANIFCVICNNATYNPQYVCLKDKHQVKDPTFTSFSVMLDYKVVDSSEEEDAERKNQRSCEEMEVKHPFKDECRTILCPTGHLRTADGCKIYTSVWYMRGYQLFLDLEPSSQADGLLTLDELLTLSGDDLKASFNEVHLPADFWLLYAETMIKKDSDKTIYVKNLSFNVANGEYPVDVSQALEDIKFATSHNLTFIIQNKLHITTYSYTVNFAKRHGSHFDALARDHNYTYISSSGSQFNPLIITKLYFCEQVRLWPEEWHSLDNSTPSIEITLGEGVSGKVLQEFEYSRHTAANGDEYVQICVEDFNPNPKQYIGNATVHLSCNVFLSVCIYFAMYCCTCTF